MPRKRRSTRGSITQRGKGSWFIEFRVKSGVRVRETVRGSREDAELRLTQLLREHDVTGIVPDREATVASFSKTWLDHVAHRVKPTTLKRYRELLQVHVGAGRRSDPYDRAAAGRRLRGDLQGARGSLPADGRERLPGALGDARRGRPFGA
jgi:hypothetical protein